MRPLHEKASTSDDKKRLTSSLVHEDDTSETSSESSDDVIQSSQRNPGTCDDVRSLRSASSSISDTLSAENIRDETKDDDVTQRSGHDDVTKSSSSEAPPKSKKKLFGLFFGKKTRDASEDQRREKNSENEVEMKRMDKEETMEESQDELDKQDDAANERSQRVQVKRLTSPKKRRSYEAIKMFAQKWKQETEARDNGRRKEEEKQDKETKTPPDGSGSQEEENDTERKESNGPTNEKEKQSMTEDGGSNIALDHYVKVVTQVAMSKARMRRRQQFENGKRNDAKSDVLGITVHRADRLTGPANLVQHPSVQVLVSSESSGELLPKSDKRRKTTSYYETRRVFQILPLMTQPYDLARNRSLCCQWEEMLIFNEDISYILDPKTFCILFFLLQDFEEPTCDEFFPKSKKLGMRTHCWAFLKLVRADGQTNVGQRLRLQLFHPRKSYRVSLRDVYSWWKSGSRLKYPATLHITVCGVALPSRPDAALRSFLPTQKERSITANTHPLSQDNSPSVKSAQEIHERTLWKRKPNELCKIPNKIRSNIPTQGGCLCIKFSDSGEYLACGNHFDVLLYSVVEDRVVGILQGHFDIISDLSWSSGDKLLASASADCTVRIWDMKDIFDVHMVAVLTHPASVNTSRFPFCTSDFIISGCHDHVVRVWKRVSDFVYEVVEEKHNHLGYITAMCFSIDGNVLYTGDSQGMISEWKVNVDEMADTGNREYLLLENQVSLPEIEGVVINSLSSHPGGYRLLLHTRNSQIRLLSLKHWVVTNVLYGALNEHELVRSCFTPCGRYIVSGGEDGGVYVWNTDTGNLEFAFIGLPLQTTASCVEFHPHDNIMAVCAAAARSAVVVMVHDPSAFSPLKVPMQVKPADEVVATAGGEAPNGERFCGGTNSSAHGKEQEATSMLKEVSLHEKSFRQLSKDVLMKLDTVLKLAAEDPLQFGISDRRCHGTGSRSRPPLS